MMSPLNSRNLYYILAGLAIVFYIAYSSSRFAYTQGKHATSFFLLMNIYLLFISKFQAASLSVFSGVRLDQILYWTGTLVGFILFFKLPKQIEVKEDYVSER